jgi:hypothetical protein
MSFFSLESVGSQEQREPTNSSWNGELHLPVHLQKANKREETKKQAIKT